jgi:hypothetical protein
MSREQDESSVFGFAFNRKKVKYSILNDLFEERILDTSVSLFIDMKYIFDLMRIKYYADMVEREFVRDSNRVIAEILNFVVHYKRYFVEKRGCDLDVFLMFDAGDIPDKYKVGIDPAYDKVRMEKTIKPKFLGFVGEKMQRFSHCIPDLYVINSGDVELTVIPDIVQRVHNNTKYNVFISNDPLIQQYSQTFKGFYNLHPNGENSKVVTTNGYFQFLYEKNKYAVKSAEELKTHDSFIQLYSNLIGVDEVAAIGKFKSKKAIDLVNAVKRKHTIFNDYDVLTEGEYGFSGEDIALMKQRAPIFDVHAHSHLLSDADVTMVETQIKAANKVSRDDFDHYNTTAFDNRVEVSTLFM